MLAAALKRNFLSKLFKMLNFSSLRLEKVKHFTKETKIRVRNLTSSALPLFLYIIINLSPPQWSLGGAQPRGWKPPDETSY